VIAAAFVAGVLVTSAVAGAFALRDDGSSPADDGSAPTAPASSGPSPLRQHDGSPRPASANPSASPSAGQSVSPPVDAAERQAQMTKPLADLVAGDRVVYNMVTCHFRRWVGTGQAVALITCPGEAPFQARTQMLVPVEVGGD
jgi:hypothetical protein